VTHFDDLSPCDYFGPTDGILLAVGWLDRAHSFTKGTVDRAIFEKLASLLHDPWQLGGVFAGKQPCEFCVFTGGPGVVAGANVGSTNLFVPDDDCAYVAPSLILHYIDAHEYRPPERFQRAVEACPEMRSIGYLKRLRALGLHRPST